MGHASDEDIRQRNERVEQHAPCPFCGYGARLEWCETGQGVPCVLPTCALCGAKSPTALPVPCGMGGIDGMIPMNLSPAWDAWDHPYWLRNSEVRAIAMEQVIEAARTLVASLPPGGAVLAASLERWEALHRVHIGPTAAP
jgi:hypothetical protein